jgi:hypothetical protein
MEWLKEQACDDLTGYLAVRLRAPREAAYSLLTPGPNPFVTQMFAPSKATKFGLPTENVPSTAPVEAKSLVTLLLPAFATQTLAPSKAMPCGVLPTG